MPNTTAGDAPTAARGKARQWISKLLLIHQNTTDISTDAKFKPYLEQQYAVNKAFLTAFLTKGASSPDTMAALNNTLALGLYQQWTQEGVAPDKALRLAFKATQAETNLFALGLFAFGHLDAAEDILAGTPLGLLPYRAGRDFTAALKAALPLPANVDPATNPAQVLQWLQANQNNLQWNANTGAYTLTS